MVKALRNWLRYLGISLKLVVNPKSVDLDDYYKLEGSIIDHDRIYQLIGMDSEKWAQIFLPHIPIELGTILDLGCAEGHMQKYFPGWDYIGVDRSPGNIEKARERQGEDSTFYVANANNLKGIENESADMVLCLGTIEHLLEPRSLLREIHRVLKPTGSAIVSVPSRLGLSTGHIHQYSKSKWENILSESFRAKHIGNSMIMFGIAGEIFYKLERRE